MCGITGSFGGPADDVEAALTVLAHRGPDGKGVRALRRSTLGHTRLAIIDIEGGDQPISSPDGTRWLVCNGEIYNYPDLREQFSDYPFKTQSDNEIILPMYERYGPEMIHQLNGMFAFVIVSDDEIFMARDPLGIKPLYYGWDGDTLHFASEIKALHDKVEKLEIFPPGHYYSNRTGLVRYYDVNQIGEPALNKHALPTTPRQVYSNLREAVRRRMMADVPVGVFLSGGLDSSIIAALAVEFHPNIHSFAVGVEGSVDMKYARMVAQHLGTTHHEYIYTPEEMLEALPDVIYHLESFDPPLVRSAIPNYFLARLARQHVTVVLSGEGADELYAGYHYLKTFADGTDLHKETLRLTDDLHSCNLQRCDRMTMAHGLEGRVPFLDIESVALAFSIPTTEKISGAKRTEKWVLRKAFEDHLPHEVVWRVKEQFSQGAGSAHLFEEYAETHISDAEFAAETDQVYAAANYRIQTKEELLYYRCFRQHFPLSSVLDLVRPWRGT